jgi:glycosyltransferase involved in cell wall biosynthesis
VANPPDVQATPFRIVRIITRLNIGGPAIQAIDLSRELKVNGFETCLIHGALAEGEGDMTALLPIGDVQSIHVKTLVRPISPWNDIRACWKIYRMLCVWRPAIVHTHMAKAGTLGRLAALLYNRTRGRKARTRIVHTYHGHVFEGYFGSFSTKVFLAIERWLGRRTDTLIAISDQIKQDLLHTFTIASERQIAVIPLGFDLTPFLALTSANRQRARETLHIPTDALVVTTVGRLTEIKQHALFLQVAAELARRSSRFVFLLAGDGELRDVLERQAEAMGIDARVRFLGWRGDLDQIYAATDLFLLTSRNEGTPVALIEAMAAGVSAVSTDVGGVRDVIPGDRLGVLIPWGDGDRLTEAVFELANAPARRAEMGDNARAFVRERFDRQRLIRDITSLYWRLLGACTTMPSS